MKEVQAGQVKASVRPAGSTRKVVVKAVKVGIVTHYFSKAQAAAVRLSGVLSIGDPVWIKGTRTDFRQTVSSLQIDRKVVEMAGAGQEIGMSVLKEVRQGDVLYRLSRKG